jgi:nicotinamide mononucleotide adenylyltransferase
MNDFADSLLSELKLAIYSEDIGGENFVVFFAGKFQPFCIHHHKAYLKLVEKFGKDNVYIVMSKDDKPFSFSERLSMISGYGIPKSQVLKVNKGKAHSLKDLFDSYDEIDPKDMTVVYAVGKKDEEEVYKNMLGKRSTRWSGTSKMKVSDVDNPYLYYTILPNVDIEVENGEILTSELAREMLSDTNVSMQILKDRFKQIFGRFDEETFNVVMRRLNNNASVVEGIGDWVKGISKLSKEQFVRMVSIIKKEYSDTKGLYPIMKKWAKRQPITAEEKKIFKTQMIDCMKLIGLGSIAALPFPGTTALIPVIVSVGKKYGVNMLPTEEEIVREKLTSESFWKDVMVESVGNLVEGYDKGSLMQSFADETTTFGHIKELMKIGLTGEITLKTVPLSSMTGLKMFVSFSGSTMVCARNRIDMKAGGMQISKLMQTLNFPTHTSKTISFSLRALQDSFKKLSSSVVQSTFGDKNNWASIEIFYATDDTVFDFDGPSIVLYDVCSYSNQGERIREISKAVSPIKQAIKNTNSGLQRMFSSSMQNPLRLVTNRAFSIKYNSLVNRLNRYANKMGCRDTDSLNLWHRKWWETYIRKNTKSIVNPIDPTILEGLINRWAFGDKKFAITTKTIDNPSLLSWARSVDLKAFKIRVENSKEFDSIIMMFCAEVLENMGRIMVLSEKSEVKKLVLTLKEVQRGLVRGIDSEFVNKFIAFMRKVQSIGGIKAIVPAEGILFMYKGIVYRMNASFSQIDLMMKRMNFKR